MSAGGLFWWWDDAVAYATMRARVTGRRYRVFRRQGMCWAVDEVVT
jgi:hypothetical protein